MKYNADKIIHDVVADLSDRQKDVLHSRYGLKDARRMTLASIGDKYGVTRERIRQIEALALGAVRAKFARGDYKELVGALKKHLIKNGGVHRETFLCSALESVIETKTPKMFSNKVNFLMESSGVFQYQPEDNDFYAFWYLHNDDVRKAQTLITKLVANLKDRKDDIIITKNSFEVIFAQTVKTVGYTQPLALNYISISKKFARNSYGDSGLSHWPEICPKTSRDWAYLVLRKRNQPLHFTELTAIINDLRKNKKTNAQTVHNELIKDSRFVLVGRGVYGLQEFNLMAGTAREVITHILKKSGPQHSRDLVKLVLKQRDFKENTLLLNLQDRRFFQRLDDGKYHIKKV